MRNSDIRFESFSFYSKSIKGSVSIYTRKQSKRIKFKTNEGTGYRPTSRGESGQGSLSASQLTLTRTNSLAKFLLESGRHDISRIYISLVFR